MVIVTVVIVIVIAMFWIILAIREKGAVTSSSAGAVATLRIIRWSLKIFTLGDPFALDDHTWWLLKTSIQEWWSLNMIIDQDDQNSI